MSETEEHQIALKVKEDIEKVTILVEERQYPSNSN